MIKLLLIATVVAATAANYTDQSIKRFKRDYGNNGGYTYNNGLVAESLQSLCQYGKQQVQLGACSAHFLQCDRGGAVIRTCPFHGHVFVNGYCSPSSKSPACRDGEMNRIKEETQHMAEQLSLCASGAALFRLPYSSPHPTSSRDRCSAQAIVCHHNGRDAVAVGCPRGQYLRDDLSCAPTVSNCYDQAKTAPIRHLLMNRMCNTQGGGHPVPIKKRDTVASQNYAHTQGVACVEWYVSCKPRPTVIRCEAGHVFDQSSQRCRPWRREDRCLMTAACSGREYQSVSLGSCQSSFLYCDGRVGRAYSCAKGTVFDGVNCVLPETVGCPICTVGEKRATQKCNEYYKCDAVDGIVAWRLLRCRPGQGWSRLTGKCHHDHKCAKPQSCKRGEYVTLSCDRYMYCTGDRFEEFFCRPGTRFHAASGQCVYDPNCGTGYGHSNNGPYKKSLSSSCSDGGWLVSNDCKTYQLCVSGSMEKRQCKNQKGWMEVACSHCVSTQAVYGVNQLSFPGQCRERTVQPHPDDCSAFYKCRGNSWEYKRCPSGEIFDANSMKCSRRGICSTANQRVCTEGERLVSEGARCDRVTECQNGQWIEMQCPQGTIYHVPSSGCIPGACPSTSPDPSRIPPSGPEPMPPAPPPVDQQVDESRVAASCDGSFVSADEFDCTRYWQCNRQGRLISRVCEAGSVFDARTMGCIRGKACSSSAAQCLDGQTQPSEFCGDYRICYRGRYIAARCNHDMQFINGRCTQKKCQQVSPRPPSSECHSGSVRPHPRDTSSYLVCYYGKWTERQCGQGRVFDWQVLGCVPHKGDWRPQLPKCYQGETRKVAGECQLYEECEYGKWVKKACYYGQMYANGRCVAGDCDKNQRCRESSGVDGYRRVRHDCSKYYQCVHGKWMERPCAPGTVFNERLAVCDHAANVPQCGGY